MARPPNILWIVTTQWRARAMGLAGDPNARTPHLDAWTRHAVNFTEAVTPHPFGPFARAALLTGVPSPMNGVADYFDPLPASARTVAHAMNDRGYATAYFGKWHLAARDPHAPLVGEAHAKTIVPEASRGGFSLWEGFEGGFLLNDPWLHGTRLPEPKRFPGYQSDVVCERAADWIAEQPVDKPWFCVVSLEPPHPPYAAPAGGVMPPSSEALQLSANVPRGGEAEARARRELSGYYAHIEATDRAIGRFLCRFDQSNTAVVFTSVHGDMHGAHGLFRKGWPHEESVRVPLLVHVPPRCEGGFNPGRKLDLVSLIDVPDWTVAWAEGRRVGPAPVAVQQLSMPSVVALRDQCDRAWRAVRTRFRKLVMADLPDEKGGFVPRRWLYFDLENDPLEQDNLAADAARGPEMDALQSLIRLPTPSPRSPGRTVL